MVQFTPCFESYAKAYGMPSNVKCIAINPLHCAIGVAFFMARCANASDDQLMMMVHQHVFFPLGSQMVVSFFHFFHFFQFGSMEIQLEKCNCLDSFQRESTLYLIDVDPTLQSCLYCLLSSRMSSDR